MKDFWLAELLEEMDKKLPQPEQEYVNALLNITKKYGKLADKDGKGIWVGYVGPEENDNASIGVKCVNCAFYQRKGVCSIIAKKIQDNGYCRLAAIPDGLVGQSSDDEEDPEEE